MGQSQSRDEDEGNISPDSSRPNSLPEECISNIISFTSPQDACVLASVSEIFESAAKSDIVWEKFLPPDYESLVSSSRDFSSKKELYFALCDNPVLIDDGKTVFMYIYPSIFELCLYDLTIIILPLAFKFQFVKKIVVKKMLENYGHKTSLNQKISAI